MGSVLLDADGPSARPWRFSLSSSSDLQQWHPLGSVTVYRHQGQWATPPRIVLEQVLRQGAFLRIDWSATDGAPLAGVQVRGATLEAPRPTAGTPQVALPLVLPPPRDAHTIEWQVPFATPIQALDVSLGEGNALLPVRLLARQQPGQAWTPLAQAVVFRLTQGGSTQSSPPITWGDARAWREWRLEADASSPGFTQPPQVTARLAPLQLVFVASGPGPFTLAAGRASASASALPLASVVPGYDASQPLRLPQASLAAGGDPAAAVPTRAPGSPWDLRQALLWAVLLSGVLALGLMAVRLMRSLPRAQADEPPAAP